MLRQLMIAGVFAANAAAANAASFELRLETACGDNDKPYQLEGTSHEYCFTPAKVIDETGVIRVERYPVIAKAIVKITPAASDRLLAATTPAGAKNLGVIFNGKLIFFAMADEPLKLDALQLSLSNAPGEVDALVAAFPGPAP